MKKEYPDEPKYIVVVGASAGGLNSVIELSAQLTAEMDMAVFVVLHLTKLSFADVLISRIQRNSAFACKVAEDGEPIKTKHVYMAEPDRHLVIEKGKIILGDGPAENRWRPSIDVLFRSAAAAYDSRVIGIILTGLMQDGTSGMLAIHRSGGSTIVQDPKQAEYPDMPLSVLNILEPDFCIPLEQIGAVLLEKAMDGVNGSHLVPDDVKAEAAIAQRVATGINHVEELGEKSNYVCPDCGGAMWEMLGDDMVRYRCYTGHVFNQNELLLRQSEALENTLWSALRMLEERKNLLLKMADEEQRKGWMKGATSKKARATELDVHVKKLKDILIESKKRIQDDVQPIA